MTIRTLAMRMLRYGPWAIQQHMPLLEQAGLLDNERVLWIVNHVTFARRLWLERVRDGRITSSPTDVVDARAALARCTDDTAAWIAWLESVASDELNVDIRFVTLERERVTQSLADIVMHVINHSTHHTHELGVILRANGVAPTPTDYIVYSRQHP
jgi:uncharacterized damage-inducible protein DinB